MLPSYVATLSIMNGYENEYEYALIFYFFDFHFRQQLGQSIP